jgi:phosphoglycerol transferase MdoB-like AlkP superfamily enzyme
MKNIPVSLLKQTAFWILFFNFLRLIFIIYHIDLIRVEHITFPEVLGIFFFSFKLDLATACYLMIIPFLLLVVQSIIYTRWLNIINYVYSGFMIFAYSLVSAGEMGIYSEWKTKLNYKVIKYFNHPSEIFNSAGTGTFFLLLLLFILMFAAGLYFYLKYFAPRFGKPKRNLWITAAFIFLTPGLLFLGLRGGWQAIPINQSQSYYSKHNILNIASVNNAFNLYISIFENLKNFNRNPFVFMDDKKAEKLVSEIYHVKTDTTISILTNQKPNIVILILESWSADLVESLGGKPGITPEFRKLEKEGILFTQLYSAGARSEQGMASIFGGFPAHPISCATVQPDKYEQLPSLPQTLEKDGYSTAFYFGGQLIYGNIKGYIYYNGFDKIMEGKDFPSDYPKGKLGIHDQFTLDYLAGDLKNLRQPFFAALFTVSTHSPYDQPFEKPLKWGENENEYINGGYYTDHCLGDFFATAKLQPWYSNTLFIIVADHSHNSYYNWHPNTREYHKIPMLFYGDVIRKEFRGTQWAKMGNHNDIPATLLAQMGLPSAQFHWSKNLFNPYTPDFAYFTNENGAGWLRPGVNISFDKGNDNFYAFEMDPKYQDSLFTEGKAYLQRVFEDYLGK